MKKKNKILVTGGSGRFGKILKKQNFKDYFFPDKKELDITSIKSIKKFILKKRPKIIIHLAGLSRPVQLHESNLIESINLNIIGTSNLILSLYISLQTMFILVQKVIIKKLILFYLSITMAGQNSGESLLFTCIKTLSS